VIGFAPSRPATLHLRSQVVSVIALFFIGEAKASNSRACRCRYCQDPHCSHSASVFSFVLQDTVSLGLLVVINGVVLVAVWLALKRGGKQFSTHGLLPDFPIILKYVAIFAAVLFGCSPILQTLTQAFCNDTIWGCCMLLFSVHVCNHEYQISSSSSV
jgi:hypothetical protein